MENIEMTADAEGTLPTVEFCQAIDRVRAGRASLVVHFTSYPIANGFYMKALERFPELGIDWSNHTFCQSVSFQSTKHKVVSI